MYRTLDGQREANRSIEKHRQAKDNKPGDKQEYSSELEQVGSQIDSVQEFWRYYNNMPIANIKTRESVYLFKSGFKPIWEDRRNINGGSWTFRVPKDMAENLWKHVQMLAIGEQLEEALANGKRSACLSHCISSS